MGTRPRGGAAYAGAWRRPDQEGAAPRRPLVLVHGSSLSALPTFDLQVPERPDHSLMDWLARRGHDVWTLDPEGYGRSTITASNADVATGVEDLRAALVSLPGLAHVTPLGTRRHLLWATLAEFLAR